MDALISLFETRMKPIRILLVDDHRKLLSQIEARLSYEEDFEIVGKASERGEALETAQTHKPEIVLLDPVTGEGLDIELIKGIRNTLPLTVIVVLTAFVDTAMLVELRKFGISKVLEKGIDSNELIGALREAAPLAG
jgi:two-component system nitrate/nitrite response regulator NarL